MSLEWSAAPPPGESNRGFWVNVLAELQTRPNEWAVVYRQRDGETAVNARTKVQSLAALARRHNVSLEKRTVAVDGVIVGYARVVE